MPTAAKLVAAIFFGMIAYLVAVRVITYLPEETVIGRFREVMGAIGLVCGWMMMGPRAADSFWMAIVAGITTSALIIFWGLVFVSGYQMLVKSYGSYYDGPLEALEAMLRIAAERSAMLLNPDVAGLFIVGALLGGALSWLAARLWR